MVSTDIHGKNKEFEKRYLLVLHPSLDGLAPEKIIQGYLSTDPERTVRVREISKNVAKLTIKGLRDKGEAPEYEYVIPHEDFAGLVSLCGTDIVVKDRYPVLGHDGKKWEVDFFQENLAGLVIAELEMKRGASFLKPVWLDGAIDITNDNRFSNAALVKINPTQLRALIASVQQPKKPGFTPS